MTRISRAPACAVHALLFSLSHTTHPHYVHPPPDLLRAGPGGAVVGTTLRRRRGERIGRPARVDGRRRVVPASAEVRENCGAVCRRSQAGKKSTRSQPPPPPLLSTQRHQKAGRLHQQPRQPAAQDAGGQTVWRGAGGGGRHHCEAARDARARGRRGGDGKKREGEGRETCFVPVYHASRHSWIVPRGQGRGERGAAWAQGATVVGSQKQKELKQDKFLLFHRTSFPQGRDHTLFALSPGVVTFGKDRRTGRKTVSIVPAEA